MNRSFFGRAASTFVVVLGLMLGLLSGTSSAQVIDSASRPQVGGVQTEQVRTQGSASSYGVHAQGSASSYAKGAYYECGYYRNWGEAYYTHCGMSAFPDIRVSFNFGMTTRTIQVFGTTNLSRHPKLQLPAAITGAWCVNYCW